MHNLESKMRDFVKRLGLPLDVAHVPALTSSKHGEIKDDCILIYDVDEETAWITLLHEVLELRMRPILKVYRDTINHLITLIDELAYSRKEEALSNIITDFSVWRSLEADRLGSTNHKARRSASIET